jgi:hypothetical protein
MANDHESDRGAAWAEYGMPFYKRPRLIAST